MDAKRQKAEGKVSLSDEELEKAVDALEVVQDELEKVTSVVATTTVTKAVTNSSYINSTCNLEHSPNRTLPVTAQELAQDELEKATSVAAAKEVAIKVT